MASLKSASRLALAWCALWGAAVQPFFIGQLRSFVARAQRHRIQLSVNGTKTVDYRETEKDIAKRGIIGLQIHVGKPLEAWSERSADNKALAC